MKKKMKIRMKVIQSLVYGSKIIMKVNNKMLKTKKNYSKL